MMYACYINKRQVVILCISIVFIWFLFYQSLRLNKSYGTPPIKQSRNPKQPFYSKFPQKRKLTQNNPEQQSQKDSLKFSQSSNVSFGTLFSPSYLIKPSHICSEQGSGLKILILITSAPNHFSQRLSIRYTWGSFAQRKDVDIAFVVGSLKVNQTDEQIASESKRYGDIIQGNFDDSYRNLTLKTMFMLRYFDEHCSHAAFLMKTDDDVFVNVNNLLMLLDKHHNEKVGIWGTPYRRAPPIRDKKNKYFMSEDIYPNKRYPTFVAGPAYIMTNLSAILLSQNAEGRKLYPLEDVFFTGVLAEELKIPRGRGDYMMVGMPKGLKLEKVVSQHYSQPDDMFRIWKYLGTGILDKKKYPPKKRNSAKQIKKKNKTPIKNRIKKFLFNK